MQIQTYTSFDILEQSYKEVVNLRKLNLVLGIVLIIFYILVGIIIGDFFDFPLFICLLLGIIFILFTICLYIDEKNKKKIFRTAIEKREHAITSFNEDEIAYELYNGDKKIAEGIFEYNDLMYKELKTYVLICKKENNLTGIIVYKEQDIISFLRNKNVLSVEENKKLKKKKKKSSE